jgi:hypothetical protein
VEVLVVEMVLKREMLIRQMIPTMAFAPEKPSTVEMEL